LAAMLLLGLLAIALALKRGQLVLPRAIKLS